MDRLLIRGARANNLKGIDLDIPRGKLVVITGVSGSGKSSLAFDTIYAEGQRRYVESLSVYARQFLERMARPDVDTIEGLSPAISIEQRPLTRNPRSTVGTVTEIYDYLRLLYARVGLPHCFRCGKALNRQTVQEIVSQALAAPEGARVSVLAPVERGARAAAGHSGELGSLFERLRKDGYTRVRVDGTLCDLAEEIRLGHAGPHDVDVVVDRVQVKPDARARLSESIEVALRLAGGVVKLLFAAEGDGAREMVFSEHLACHECGVSYPELTPRLFSFNSPDGACATCAGIGALLEFEESLIVPDVTRSLREGAIEPWHERNPSYHQGVLERVGEVFGFSLVRPYKELPAAVRSLLMHGHDRSIEFSFERGGKRQSFRRAFEGVIPYLRRRLDELQRKQTEARSGSSDPDLADDALAEIQRYMRSRVCPDCAATRLRIEARHVLIGQRAIHEVAAMSVRQALSFFETLELDGRGKAIAGKLLLEIGGRLSFLHAVGVDYLTLDRASATLSGGEGQRVRLATQIGAALVGVLYVLDEPSMGLHPRDNERLLATLLRLRDQGNSVLVVEHDEETMRRADFLVDLGPGAGEHGGRLIASGSPEEVSATAESVTGQFLSGSRAIAVPPRRRAANRQALVLRGARHNNLADIDLAVPLGCLTCVTGVSGSGKSSLVVDTLLPALRRELHGCQDVSGGYRALEGAHLLDRVIAIDQAPIGRSPRSNPATYTGMFGLLRELYAELPESRVRGYRAGRFSFNVKGGRCEACRGDGTLRIAMHFLPDVFVTCEICGGRRYNEETLRIKYRGKSIADVLQMSVDEGRLFLRAIPRLDEKLSALIEVGLGYIRLGQPANTLSGGEAQRVKLSRELGRRSSGRTLYILDEPTTGLHFADIDVLMHVLNRLVEAGNTVLVIEHNLDVIKCADHVVDLGPEGGAAGGRLLASGTPEEVARVDASHTGRYLRRVLPR